MWMAARQPRHEREPRPQHPIDGRQAETRAARSIHDGQLVSERDDFQVQQGTRPDQEAKGVKERDNGRHDCRLSENARNLNRRVQSSR
jgi:hypothetical protein